MAKNVCLLVLMSLAMLASAENKSTWLFSSSNKATAAPPMPGDPCSDIVYNMMDCMDFLNLDQPTDSKPSASCCTGFNSVLAVSPLCVCEAVKTASEIGLALNMTRAASLPGLCGATTFDNGSCQDNAAPGEAPAPPTASPTTLPPSPPPSQKKAPAPATVSPTVSGSHSLSAALTMLAGVVGGLVLFYFAY